MGARTSELEAANSGHSKMSLTASTDAKAQLLCCNLLREIAFMRKYLGQLNSNIDSHTTDSTTSLSPDIASAKLLDFYLDVFKGQSFYEDAVKVANSKSPDGVKYLRKIVDPLEFIDLTPTGKPPLPDSKNSRSMIDNVCTNVNLLDFQILLRRLNRSKSTTGPQEVAA